MSRRTLVNLIFFNGVFVLMLWWAVNNIVTLDVIERPYTITGDFEQAAGVSSGSEVTYLGVSYGYVSSVERNAGGVSVTMKIDRDKQIPAGSIARIFRKSAIGEPYIDFVPPASYRDGGEHIEAGENVPIERTTVPLEFSELLRSASALIGSIDPEAAGSVVHELALALDGRSEDLRAITTSIDTLTGTFVERTDQLDRLAENGTRITKVVADHRLSLGRSIDNLRAVTEALERADGDLHALLDVGPRFLETTADLVADKKQAIDCLLTDLAPVIGAMGSPARTEDLRTLLRTGPTGFGYVAASIDDDADGPWIRVNLLAPLEGDDPKVYVPPRGLPVVPTVSACASELQPAAVAAAGASSAPGRADEPAADDRAAADGGGAEEAAASSHARSGLAGFLARTGAAGYASIAVLLLAAAGAAWAARRRIDQGGTTGG